MNSLFNSLVRLLVAGVLAVTVWPSVGHGQTTPQDQIHEDTVWSGRITVTTEVRIFGATVRVEPGTIIQLDGEGATIRLSGAPLAGARPSRQASIVLAGTEDRPITIETTTGHRPGRIAADPMTGCSLTAQHVIFRRLGATLSQRRCEPAVFLVLPSDQTDLWISDCRFEQCGPVHAEFIGQGATAEISRCTFADASGHNAIVLLGTGSGVRVVRDNVADAGFRVECPQVLLQNNILVGEWASITVPNTSTEAVRIVENYVHCTGKLDDGRYVLRCRAAKAILQNNVLRGGSYVVESAPRTVTGNVLIGNADLKANLNLPGLELGGGPRDSTTHYLMTNLVSGAHVTDNLLLGPAHAAIAIESGSTNLTIENNLFDGWQMASRAIHFNRLPVPASAAPAAAVVRSNVITRYRVPPVMDGATRAGTLAELTGNVFAEVTPVPCEQIAGMQALPPGNQHFESLGDLRLKLPVATRSALDVDDQLIRRRLSVAQLLNTWRSAYVPLDDSPLVTGGRVGPRIPSR